MLTVTTAADATNLVTLAEVKSKLRLTGTEEDALLAALIAEASQACCDHVGRPIARQRYTETVKAYDLIELQLSRFPIDTDEEVTVTIDGGAVTDFSIEDAEAGILLREVGWPWSGSLSGIDFRAPDSEVPTVTVVYTAGWGVPSQVAPAGSLTLPASIARACFETVKEWWLRDQRDPAITGRNVPQAGGAAAVSYAPPSTELLALPPVALALLRPYRCPV